MSVNPYIFYEEFDVSAAASALCIAAGDSDGADHWRYTGAIETAVNCGLLKTSSKDVPIAGGSLVIQEVGRSGAPCCDGFSVIKRKDLIAWAKSKGFDLFPDIQGDPQQAAPTYTTPILNLIHAAIIEHWQGVDPKGRDAPSNDFIEEWLVTEGRKRGIEISANIAKVAATIIRHPEKPRGNTRLG